MKRIAALCLAIPLAAAAQDAAALFFSRDFPASNPPYIQVTVSKTGDGEYREAVNDDWPIKFKVSGADVAQVFTLAEKLDYFKHPLESPAKVAFMGTKTFRYTDGVQKSEVKFNYSQDTTALALLDWFERVEETEQRYIALERSVKYDHLGVFRALVLIEDALQGKRVVAPEQFLPLLDRVIKNEVYMHTARARAAELAELIRNPPAKP